MNDSIYKISIDGTVGRTRTLKPLRINNVVAQITGRNRSITGHRERIVRDAQARARRRTTALKGHHPIALQRAMSVVELNILKSRDISVNGLSCTLD